MEALVGMDLCRITFLYLSLSCLSLPSKWVEQGARDLKNSCNLKNDSMYSPLSATIIGMMIHHSYFSCNFQLVFILPERKCGNSLRERVWMCVWMCGANCDF